MSEPSIDVEQSDAPHAHEFASQLIGQLLGDLDGILFEVDAPTGDARTLIFDAAAAGRMRAATLPLLVRAALSAHAALLSESDGDFPLPNDEEVVDAMRSLLTPAGTYPHKALQAEARLQQQMTAVDPRHDTLCKVLAQAIYRLYDGMRSGDEASSSRGLLELRSMLVHLDAMACALSTEPAPPPRRVLRPDRFNDLYIGYLEAVRTGDKAQQPVATLQQNGRIAALITETAHPVQLAEQSLRENLAEHAEDALARIRALVFFLDDLRRQPHPVLAYPAPGTSDDQILQLSLITAAAIAPVHGNGRYAFGELAQVARYNQSLLRAPQGDPARTH